MRGTTGSKNLLNKNFHERFSRFKISIMSNSAILTFFSETASKYFFFEPIFKISREVDPKCL